MVLLSGLEKPEQGLKLNVKDSLKIDGHIIINKSTTFYSGILHGDTCLFLPLFNWGIEYYVYTLFFYIYIYALYFTYYTSERNN